MAFYCVGDRIGHAEYGEGTITRTGIGSKRDLLEVVFDEESEVGKFIQETSKHIEAVNGKPVNRKLVDWRPADYIAASNRYFSERQSLFLKNFLIRITYRPHPYSFEKFVTDYETVTGAACPLTQTNRHESAYSDCAEIYFSAPPEAGLFEFQVKQAGELWFTESVGLAWSLFRTGFLLAGVV